MPKVGDFGLAKLADEDAGHTRTEQVRGPPSYMSPEPAAGDVRSLDARTDVYALGAVLYECLTGRPPFKGASALETLELVRTQEPVRPAGLNPKVPRDLEIICLKCLEKTPARRYAGAAELADDLERFLEGRPIRARAPSRWYRFARFTRRNKVVVGSLAAVFLALVLGIAGVGVGLARALDAESEALQAKEEKEELLADSLYQVATLRMQRGDWAGALRSLDEALKAGHPQRGRLRLDRVKALMALNRAQDVAAELARLEESGEAGGHAAELLLWQGDLELGDNNERALERVGRALALGTLGAADRAYAEGLRAKTSPGAVACWRRALAADPAHLRAHEMIGVTLLMLGHKEEARRRNDLALALYPEGPNFLLLGAILHALEGDREAARRRLGQMRDRFGAAPFELTVDLFAPDFDFERLVFDTAYARVTAVRVAARFLGVFSSVRPGQGPDVRVALPPHFAEALGPWRPRQHDLASYLKLIESLLSREKVVKNFESLAEVNPEGTILLILAKARMNQATSVRDWEAARGLFEKSAGAPFHFPARRVALAYLAFCEAVLSCPGGAPGVRADPARARRAAAHIRELLRGGPIRFFEHVPHYFQAAITAEDLPLAREMLQTWERLRPNDPRLPLERGGLALREGAYFRAIPDLRKARELSKDDPERKKLCDDLLRRVREEIEEHLKHHRAGGGAGELHP